MFGREIISESNANQIALTSKKWRDREVSQNLQAMVFNSADLVDGGDDITLTNSFSRLEDDEIEVEEDINQGETLVSSVVLNVSKTA